MQQTPSSSYRLYSVAIVGIAIAILSGCATKAQNARQGPFIDTIVASASSEEAWKITRDVLLDMDVEIYTRDKRGLFVVYANQHRRKLFVPHRTMLTITLEPESDTSTRIAVETVHQKYGVTLLTHPEWRDQPDLSTDPTGSEILKSIKSTISRKR